MLFELYILNHSNMIPKGLDKLCQTIKFVVTMITSYNAYTFIALSFKIKHFYLDM